MKELEKSSTVLESGNILFSYQPLVFRNVILWALSPVYIVILVNMVELYTSHSVYSLVLLFFAMPVALSLLLKLRDKRNKAIEERIVFRHLNDIVQKDICDIDNTVVELERCYVRTPVDDSITYGQRQLEVQLSNGEKMIYEITNPKMLDKILLLEINVHYKAIPFTAKVNK